jgi:uncharacterized protein with von Willebrand factor type A (vWA) domain
MHAVIQNPDETDQEIRWNLKCAEEAVAQQKLEGLQPSNGFVVDLKRAARGQMTLDQVAENIERRYERQILESRPLPR